MASLACSLIVRVVSSAMASVADSPGRMPITMPTNAPPSPYSRVMGFMKLSQAVPRSCSPCSMGASGQADEEHALEHQPGDHRGADADGERLDPGAGVEAALRRIRADALEHED